MVIMVDRGWLGAGGKVYATAAAAHESLESFARRFGWAKPQVSQDDLVKDRPLRVFLCHAREDKIAVRELYNRLAEKNVDPWLDEVKLLPGQKWRDEISRAIRATDAFVVCLSEVAVSKVGYINREVKEALEVADQQPQGKIFNIPLKLQQCDVPERFREFQWVDYFDPRGFSSLLASLKTLAEWLREHGSKVSLPA